MKSWASLVNPIQAYPADNNELGKISQEQRNEGKKGLPT